MYSSSVCHKSQVVGANNWSSKTPNSPNGVVKLIWSLGTSQFILLAIVQLDTCMLWVFQSVFTYGYAIRYSVSTKFNPFKKNGTRTSSSNYDESSLYWFNKSKSWNCNCSTISAIKKHIEHMAIVITNGLSTYMNLLAFIHLKILAWTTHLTLMVNTDQC